MKRTILWVLVGIVAVAIGVVSDLYYHWTSYSWYTVLFTPEQVAESQKSIWDWLELLLIPLVLAGGGLWFSLAERRNEQAIAERRVNRERVIADERAQDAALESYL